MLQTSGKKVDVSRYLELKNTTQTKILQEDCGDFYLFKLEDPETVNVRECRCLIEDDKDEFEDDYEDEWRYDEDGEYGDEEVEEDEEVGDEEDAEDEDKNNLVTCNLELSIYCYAHLWDY